MTKGNFSLFTAESLEPGCALHVVGTQIFVE